MSCENPSEHRQCNLTRLHSMPRNLAKADCTCKSQNEICHIVTILIGERLAVLTVRRNTFHPAEGNSKAGKPINCNVKLWFVLDTCCTSSLRSTQLHIETQKELLLRPSSTTLLIFSSRTDTACSPPAQDHVRIHNASTTLLSKLNFGEKETQSKRCEFTLVVFHLVEW